MWPGACFEPMPGAGSEQAGSGPGVTATTLPHPAPFVCKASRFPGCGLRGRPQAKGGG